MAIPRRAERQRNPDSHSAELGQHIGSDSGAEGNQQRQSELPSENRIAAVEPESAKQPDNPGPGPASGGSSSSKNRTNRSGSSRKSAIRIPPEKSKEGLTILLTGIHTLGAKLVHECLAIDKNEAAQLSEAIFTVNELYDGGFISPKAAAWGNLLMCAGTIYGPRVAVMLLKKKLEAQQQKGQTA